MIRTSECICTQGRCSQSRSMRQYSETLRMSEQPVSQIPFKGDWGCFPNKQFAKIDPEGKSRKWVNLYRLTLLATIFLTTEWHCKDSAIQRFKPKLQWEGNRSYDALLELTTLVCKFVLHSVQAWLYRNLFLLYMVQLHRKLMPGVFLNRQRHIAACLFCRRPLVPTIGSQSARLR